MAVGLGKLLKYLEPDSLSLRVEWATLHSFSGFAVFYSAGRIISLLFLGKHSFKADLQLTVLHLNHNWPMAAALNVFLLARLEGPG